MLLEIDFAKKKKKPVPPPAVVMPLATHLAEKDRKKAKKTKTDHLTLSI